MAQQFDIRIEAGADSDVRFFVDGIDAQSGSFKMQVRKDFMTPDVIDELSNSNGRINVDADGCVHLLFSSQRSNEMRGTEAFYDIFFTDGVNVTKVLQGRFKCVLQITR